MTQLVSAVFEEATPSVAQFTFTDTTLRMEVQAHAPGVFRLRFGTTAALHPEKVRPRDQRHADALLARPDPVGEFLISSALDQKGCWRLGQGDVTLQITSAPFQLRLYRDDHCFLQTVPDAGLGLAELDDDTTQWQLALNLSETESLHGLGDTREELDRRGQRLQSDVAAHRFLPLVWSTAGWGLFVSSTGQVEHDVAATAADRYQVNVHHHAQVLDVFLFTGEPSDILNQYTALTGRPGQPGLRPMGIWLDQAPGQSTDDTIALVKSLREQGLALDGIHLAPPNAFGFHADKNNADWDAQRIPDSRTLFSRLDELKIPLMAPAMPAVVADTILFQEWEDRAWLLVKDDGDAFVCEGNVFTDGQPFGLLDLTHKDARRLWTERVRQMVDEGLTAVHSSVQVDFPDDITARGGESGAELRVLYPALARQALFDAVAGHRTPQEGVVVSTDVFPGAQRYAWQCGPQVTNDWAGLEATLRSALAMGDSGIALQTHGLGCAATDTSTMTPELYVRWLAMCVFSGNFHLQGVPELLPTAFDAPTRALIQHWLEWRYRLIPYVLGIIEDSVRTGLPVQRSMAQSFPDDPMAQVWDTQYLFGPSLLIAPVLKPGTRTEVYLPKGSDWWDLSTGWRYEGGTTWTIDAPLNTLPVFGRDGHILSLGPTALCTGDYNSARILDEVWMFGMPAHSPVVMRNRIRVMQMQGSSYIKGLEGLRILPSEGLEVKRRGAEVRISPAR
ncbi:MAG TPA: glycoside hydrolase family 31 protein [Burkholderiaceae bacterium]|nr:glycoside hydrolase family 31 protein [Burkholderiaceae bacterium]